MSIAVALQYGVAASEPDSKCKIACMPLRPDFGPCQMIGNLNPNTGTASYDMVRSILLRKPNRRIIQIILSQKMAALAYPPFARNAATASFNSSYSSQPNRQMSSRRLRMLSASSGRCVSR